MYSFKDEIALELVKSLGTLTSLRDRDQLSMTPEAEWATIMAEKIASKFEKEYVPFVSEGEEYNA